LNLSSFKLTCSLSSNPHYKQSTHHSRSQFQLNRLPRHRRYVAYILGSEPRRVLPLPTPADDARPAVAISSLNPSGRRAAVSRGCFSTTTLHLPRTPSAVVMSNMKELPRRFLSLRDKGGGHHRSKSAPPGNKVWLEPNITTARSSSARMVYLPMWANKLDSPGTQPARTFGHSSKASMSRVAHPKRMRQGKSRRIPR
jgi:hypothetical protein